MTDVPAKPLDEIKDFARKYVMFADEAHYDVLALWVLHTYAWDAAYATPYIYVTSAEPGSGKTRVLEIAEQLARSPQKAANLTTAALFRRMADSEPTVLIDEVDTIFTGAANEELRGVLNSGYKRGGIVSRFTGKEVEDFATFCPKMLVGIDNGAIPDTLMDRCIPFTLKKMKEGQRVERWIPRVVEPEGQALAKRLHAWAMHNYDRILDAPNPDYIEGISDRKFEIAEPLLILALVAGGKAYQAKMAKELQRMLAGMAPKKSEGIQVLEAAHQMFQDAGTARLRSADLADKVGMNPKKLGSVLAKYDVKPSTLSFKGTYAKGYNKRDFQDAWDRYLNVADAE